MVYSNCLLRSTLFTFLYILFVILGIYIFHKSNKECPNVKEITETCISLSIFKIDPNRYDKYTKYMKPYNYNKNYYDLRICPKIFKIFCFFFISIHEKYTYSYATAVSKDEQRQLQDVTGHSLC